MRFWSIAALALAAGCNGKDEGEETGVPDTDTQLQLDLDLITTTERPSKRSEITSVGNEATNSILLFGGNAGPVVNQIIASEFLNDTWLFQPGTGWIEVKSADQPHKRGRYAIANDEEGHRAFVFGGRYRETAGSGDYELYNDLWEFDFDTQTWDRLDNGNGVAPEPRYYPEGAYDPTAGLFYVFGGALNANPLSVVVDMNLWAWDGSGWEQLQTTGDAPSTRTYLASAYDSKRNRLVVFGGQSGNFTSCSFNDIYALDLNTLEWRQLDDGSAKAPETRFHAHLQYDAERDQYLMFGGHADIGAMNDLWSFDPETEKWDKVHIADVLTADPYAACDNIVSPGCLGISSEVPKEFADEDPTAPERRYRGMFVLMHDNLWLGEGINIECSDHLDDTWRYDIGADTWTELVEARAGESCARRGDDCECMCI
ncbi:MAG: kelch repeat-containing protein [Myxococcota bacterium]